jgi:hypothetical protein
MTAACDFRIDILTMLGQVMRHVTTICDHDHEPIVLASKYFESMPTQVIRYATARNMLPNTIGIMSMIRSWT